MRCLLLRSVRGRRAVHLALFVLLATASPTPAEEPAVPRTAGPLHGRPAPPSPAPGPGLAGPIIPADPSQATAVRLSLEYPPAGSTVGKSACGLFVSGHASATLGDPREFDVMLVISPAPSAATRD